MGYSKIEASLGVGLLDGLYRSICQLPIDNQGFHSSAAGVEGAGDGRLNALQVLIAAGARVEPVKGKTSEDAIKKSELRRLQRNVAVFLQKTLDIDTKVVPAKEGGSKGGRKSAFDVARDTKSNPVGGDAVVRELKQHSYAKAARDGLREYKKVMDAEKARKKKKEGLASGLEGGALQDGTRREGLQNMDAADLAALLIGEEEAQVLLVGKKFHVGHESM